MISNPHLMGSLKATKLCPPQAIVYNTGFTKIDYSHCGDAYSAALHHCDLYDFDYDDVIDFSFIHRFITYTPEQVLEQAAKGEVWPISFGWVERTSQ